MPASAKALIGAFYFARHGDLGTELSKTRLANSAPSRPAASERFETGSKHWLQVLDYAAAVGADQAVSSYLKPYEPNPADQDDHR
ncbi:hypothetical protein VTN77DRAFT_9763 [Rasamsonia byssochlamydoides]|uniref:uncharacterized protein n=1 Tax=Rasamsonia byssochlamydoides TaxID=89139 RepID=UPI0037427111